MLSIFNNKQKKFGFTRCDSRTMQEMGASITGRTKGAKNQISLAELSVNMQKCFIQFQHIKIGHQLGRG